MKTRAKFLESILLVDFNCCTLKGRGGGENEETLISIRLGKWSSIVLRYVVRLKVISRLGTRSPFLLTCVSVSLDVSECCSELEGGGLEQPSTSPGSLQWSQSERR